MRNSSHLSRDEREALTIRRGRQRRLLSAVPERYFEGVTLGSVAADVDAELDLRDAADEAASADAIRVLGSFLVRDQAKRVCTVLEAIEGRYLRGHQTSIYRDADLARQRSIDLPLEFEDPLASSIRAFATLATAADAFSDDGFRDQRVRSQG